MKLDSQSNDLVSYSRAGDVFHYRWAARRCLRLIQPTSNLESIVIEGSKERKKAGEYVIDVSEYYNSTHSKKRIEYFQLKHTTVQYDKPFTLSKLKDTIIGFSKRYKQHKKEKTLNGVSFTVITNRKIDETFKYNLAAIVNGSKVKKRFSDTLKKYTELNDKELIQFCNLLSLEDSEGDYNVQKEDLRVEMARLQPGSIDSAQVDSIVSLVQEKVLPNSNGNIIKEDILRPFGVTSDKQLFPAPPLFEKTDNITIRDQYQSLLYTITTANHPLIIQAEGGIGKSVFSQYVLGALPEGSLGISYDCFGSGKYRSRSGSRHRHRDALVQIVNELASVGYCERMLVQNTTKESDIMYGFLSRIKSSITSLKKVINSAKLVILIDAADNAEMAAQEFGDSCFANELLREKFPDDCKLVLLCRPERTHLLKPPGSVLQLNLLPFSKEETYENLKKWFPSINEIQALEFHRLTSGNPRVQMNSIAIGHSSVNELLTHLGPSGTTVEKQIEQQLNIAVQKIKDTFPQDYQTNVVKICTGLASLPPTIPIQVLSQASQVKTEDVRSFVADIGRSLWLLDSSVQFRDEPTETWFRNTYLGTKEDFKNYIKVLEPLALELTYVAEILPQLYLQAGQYNKLISIALSDELLPLNNPIDTRNVLVYRLQFAFKAALRSEKYKDAIKLALRAGEEVAGDQRQQNLFQNNLDLLPKLQDNLKVQEIAFKGLLKSEWEGSENMYAASLLSEIDEYKGEASGYLRSALNWLNIYFDNIENKEDYNQRQGASFDDILEIAIVHLNLNGAESCLKFLNSLKPKKFIFRVVKELASRLVDAGKFNEINKILKKAQGNKFHVVAIVSELMEVGRFAEAGDIEKCLKLLSNPKSRIKKSRDLFQDTITQSIVAFLEVCLHRNLDTTGILKALDYYVPNQASQGISSRFDSKERIVFLKALSIRKIISEDSVLNLDDLIPKVYRFDAKKRNYTDEIKEFKEVIGGLFPWFLLRAQAISDNINSLTKKAYQTNKDSKNAFANRYRSNDMLPSEIASVSSSILVYCSQQESKVIRQYYDDYIKDNSSFTIPQRISLLRAGTRATHLHNILSELENSTYEFIKSLRNAGPEEIANEYISLARAVLFGSKDDAAVYFEDAIDIVSKFGDEIVQRWDAVATLGERSATNSSDELAYRFIRCAELVGEYVYREKHWDRSGAMVTCTKMSVQIGLSALSRWRDREIGRFEYQLESVLDYLVRSKSINSTEGWSLARFLSDHDLNDFLSTCLANEPSKELRSSILNDAHELLSKEGASFSYLIQMKSIADKYSICINELNNTIDFYKSNTEKQEEPQEKRHKKVDTKSDTKIWERVFKDIDVLTSEGLIMLIDRFSSESDEKDYNHYNRLIALFKEILNRIEANEIYDFIDLLFKYEKLSYYQFEQALRSIPNDWKNKVSFKKKWPGIIKRFGCKYSHELVNVYSFRSVIRELNIDESLAKDLRMGIFQGLSKGQEITDSNTLFGFVGHASTFVNQSDACDLTDYALSRFELHIKDDFGDGPWNEWLQASNNIGRNISGFIWSALGSPRSETRWRACHVVKKMADFNCINTVRFLIEWLERNEVGAFGSKQFAFYELHARQYLLIALSRVSIDHPNLLIGHKEIFFKYTQLEPHILIQKFSAQIALNIETAIPGTYGNMKISLLKGIGKSKLETKKEKYGYQQNSYLHDKGSVDTTLNYSFGWDFDRYWFEPLGEVFGVPGKQVQDLCANVIVKEWKTKIKSGYNNDPRVSLWNRSRDRETWHDHGKYPKTDSWDFYLSYHSMLVTAARLVENMPVIISRDYLDEDSWHYWLSRHMLTRGDAKWLADYRDQLPLERPLWISDQNTEYWEMKIQDQDFLKSIKIKNNNETWLNVKGGWTERYNSKYETYSISSSLVSKKTSEALMRALATCSDWHDYKVPDYKESRVEIDSGIFELKGWIFNADPSKSIDEFDPYCGNISYPMISIGETILKELDLSSDSEGKAWYFNDGQLAMKCNAWSSNLDDYDEEPDQSGMRLSASLNLLKKLCKVYDCHLIIDINISRDIEYKYRTDKDKYEYRTHHKIFLFTEDGRLKSTTENYELR
ncbi:hypothetical protein [uncultured Aquimarina sp.]|uniref:hypothetical protein n=1 Tax=uncultured Aquimarina sp. TaxID=575652 RepID=UPI00261E301C|nr:hypothetical protein [uncultured Aquimarina sp.]